MTLTDLLNMQRELQTHSAQQPESLEQIRLAQLAELGEIVQAVKWGVEDEHPAWAWWHRDSKVPAQRDALAGELADLLCFVLLEIITLDETEVLDTDTLWGNGFLGDGYIDSLDNSVNYFFETIGADKLHAFVSLCRTFGFSQDDIETAYKAAYDKNVARWQNA